MKILLNGQPHEVAHPSTMADLVHQLGMQQDRVAVELNRSILPREQWPQTFLAEGDSLEVVHFVGGGFCI